MKPGKWEARLKRADELATAHPFAAEGLRFYQQLTGFQQSLYTGFAAEVGADAHLPPPGAPGALRQLLEVALLLPRFPAFLSRLQAIAPAPLAREAAGLTDAGSGRWEEVLGAGLRTEDGPAADLSPAESLLAWTFLQPHAEALADRAERPAEDVTPHLCPVCSSRPLAGVLRPLGDGGKRSLICALCATEWPFRRLVCPACGEEEVGKLPVYTAEEMSSIRVEACDTCRYYIKTVDMTREGRAVPVVDELAAIPLSLWAAEKEYTKLRTNLLGL
jgi:FdhE protein